MYFFCCLAVWRGIRTLQSRIQRREISPAAAHLMHDEILAICDKLSSVFGRWIGLCLLSSVFDIIARATLVLVAGDGMTTFVRDEAFATIGSNLLLIATILLPTVLLHWAGTYLPDTARARFVLELQEAEGSRVSRSPSPSPSPSRSRSRSSSGFSAAGIESSLPADDWYRLFETMRSEGVANMLCVRLAGIPMTTGFLAGTFSAAVSLAGAMLQQASGSG
jgi:hypothetical protein